MYKLSKDTLSSVVNDAVFGLIVATTVGARISGSTMLSQAMAGVFLPVKVRVTGPMSDE